MKLLEFFSKFTRKRQNLLEKWIKISLNLLEILEFFWSKRCGHPDRTDNLTWIDSNRILEVYFNYLILIGGHFYFSMKFQVFQVFQATFCLFSSGFLLGRKFFTSQIPGFPGFPEKISKKFQSFTNVSLYPKNCSVLFWKSTS